MKKLFTCDPLLHWTLALSFEQMTDNGNLKEAIFPPLLCLNTEALHPHHCSRTFKKEKDATHLHL